MAATFTATTKKKSKKSSTIDQEWIARWVEDAVGEVKSFWALPQDKEDFKKYPMVYLRRKFKRQHEEGREAHLRLLNELKNLEKELSDLEKAKGRMDRIMRSDAGCSKADQKLLDKYLNRDVLKGDIQAAKRAVQVSETKGYHLLSPPELSLYEFFHLF